MSAIFNTLFPDTADRTVRKNDIQEISVITAAPEMFGKAEVYFSNVTVDSAKSAVSFQYIIVQPYTIQGSKSPFTALCNGSISIPAPGLRQGCLPKIYGKVSVSAERKTITFVTAFTVRYRVHGQS